MITPPRFTAHPVFKTIVTPALVLLVYALFGANLLPPGVNRVFANTVVLLTAIAAIAGLLYGQFAGGPAHATAQRPASGIAAADLFLILLPLGPVANYALLNRDILRWPDILQLFVGFGAVSAVVLVLVPPLLSRWGSRAGLLAIGLGMSFSITSMANLSRVFSWHATGDPTIQLAVLLTTLLLGGMLYHKDRKSLYVLCVVLFTGNIAQTLLTAREAELESESGDDKPLLHRGPAARTPSIFLLTYDAYVENETMLQYGIDNQPQERWLEENGFHVYRGTYSVAATSTATMGRLLGNGKRPESGVAGRSPFFDQLAHAGYVTHGIFRDGYFFQGVGAHYDHSFPAPSSSASILGMAILEGQFRHNADFAKPDHLEYVTRKRQVMSTVQQQPTFLYTHTGPGHSQNSGACLADETVRFKARLVQANEEMRGDIATLLPRLSDAIIIVNGDHGPYLTKTCYDLNADEFEAQTINRLDIQDRYGTFLAVRWPDSAPAQAREMDINLLQDLTPALLGYLYPEQSFAAYRTADKTLLGERRIAGVAIVDGTIVGGADNGLPLYKSRQRSNE